MTNAEKYLKDEINAEELAKEFESFCEMLKENYVIATYRQEMEQFLKCEIKPTLTEDCISKDKIIELLKFHKEQIKLVDSHEFYNQELGYIEALEQLLKRE